MDGILTDISAWTVYASGAPLADVPQAEAKRVIEGARYSAGAVAELRHSAWWGRWESYARALLGLPADREIPVHVGVQRRWQHGAKDVLCHRLPRKIPEGLIKKAHLGPDLEAYVVSPSVYPLLRAKKLDEIALASLLSQLWGDYLVRPDQGGRPRYRRSPMTSMQEVAVAMSAMESCRGLRSLDGLLSHVAEGSHSPMETVLQLALCLPKRVGGCDLPIPAMNCSVELPLGLRSLFQSRFIRPDLAWLKNGLVVEYDSYSEHDQTQMQAQRDRNRRDAYDRLGLRIVTVDRPGMRDDVRRNLAFERIAQILGYDFDWSSDAQQKRRDLVWRLIHLQQSLW